MGLCGRRSHESAGVFAKILKSVRGTAAFKGVYFVAANEDPSAATAPR